MILMYRVILKYRTVHKYTQLLVQFYIVCLENSAQSIKAIRINKPPAKPPPPAQSPESNYKSNRYLFFPFIGKIKCAIRGPRSLAGLIAYPVGPPK